MRSEPTDIDNAARSRALSIVLAEQERREGRGVPTLEIIDRLNADVEPDDLAQATVFWQTVLMQLSSNEYGWLEFDLPGSYKLTRRGWEEGMNKNPGDFPWAD